MKIIIFSYSLCNFSWFLFLTFALSSTAQDRHHSPVRPVPSSSCPLSTTSGLKRVPAVRVASRVCLPVSRSVKSLGSDATIDEFATVRFLDYVRPLSAVSRIHTPMDSHTVAKILEMIAAGIDPNVIVDPERGDTALMFAVRSKSQRIVQALVAAGAVPTVKNKAGHTAADLAEIYGADGLAFALMGKRALDSYPLFHGAKPLTVG